MFSHPETLWYYAKRYCVYEPVKHFLLWLLYHYLPQYIQFLYGIGFYDDYLLIRLHDIFLAVLFPELVEQLYGESFAKQLYLHLILTKGTHIHLCKILEPDSRGSQAQKSCKYKDRLHRVNKDP